MKRTSPGRLLACCGFLLFFHHSAHTAGKATVSTPYVFSDETATVELEGPALPMPAVPVPYEIKTLTRSGWGPSSRGEATLTGLQLQIRPLCEGIHIVRFGSMVESPVRFLAIEPPAPLDASGWKALARALPRSGNKLRRGEPFRILAMGDSVTHTGDYESMLVRMLARATGDKNISFVDRSYPGRSVDATVRSWPDDGPPNRPDLGLLMYGLNDQITNVPLEAYLEQYEWVARRLRELNADCAFLQPTPDIGIPTTEADRKPDSNPPAYIVRTANFGAALRPLAASLQLPLAETFDAVWGSGGGSLEDTAQHIWPLLPPSYSRQMESMLETGKGDTIHLNALGHLQIARAVYRALTGGQTTSPWNWTARTRWTAQGAVSEITARNTSGIRRSGKLEVQPPTDAILLGTVPYDLAPGQEVRFSLLWPQARQPQDLRTYPNDRYLAQGNPILPIVDFENGTSRVHTVAAPFQPQAHFIRERHIVNGNRTTATLEIEGKRFTQAIEIPTGSEVGRIPLTKKVEKNDNTGWAMAELVYVRYGAARTGETNVDGDLQEWANASWVPVGEPVQARSWQRQDDKRVTPQECYLHWSFKAGKDGIYLAARATGSLEKDSFTLFFDPRSPDQLGTVGRYYWIAGQLRPEGKLQLGKGETSKEAPGLTGTWRSTETGTTLELFVPYAALDAAAWPTSGDLGLSVIWSHLDSAGKKTVLTWSENGHWWTPRWYGVVRRTDAAEPKLPYMVRVQ